ncbi:MAG: methyltransferase domain-containing protein [Acidobacteriota bacterium]|nr:methyltransferase domain-containing protein [Acidobacteriota bacterium]
MNRKPSDELLDHGQVSTNDRLACLDDIWRINQRWGGISGTLAMFEHFFARTGRHPIRVLDVGTGDGRLAARLQRELASLNFKAEFTVLDRQLIHLRGDGSHGPAIHRVAGDVLSLPFRPGSFEVVMCNLFLHHFSGEAATRLLRSLAAAAGEAVIVNDLDRRWLPYLLIRFAPLIARNRISRLDGAASVRQAYTRGEMAALAEETLPGTCETLTLPGFRNGMILWREGSVVQQAR